MARTNSDSQTSGAITVLLKAWKEAGDLDARDKLFSLVEGDLHTIARSALRRMTGFEHKLQPTELVNELYLRLANYEVTWNNRRFFFGMVSRVVRNILLDAARRDDAAKRPPTTLRVDLEDVSAEARRDGDYDVADFYRALDHLRTLNPRHADTIELHGVLGLSLAEVAQHHGVSTATAKRDLQAAKVWLRFQMGEPHHR